MSKMSPKITFVFLVAEFVSTCKNTHHAGVLIIKRYNFKM